MPAARGQWPEQFVPDLTAKEEAFKAEKKQRLESQAENRLEALRAYGQDSLP